MSPSNELPPPPPPWPPPGWPQQPRKRWTVWHTLAVVGGGCGCLILVIALAAVVFLGFVIGTCNQWHP